MSGVLGRMMGAEGCRIEGESERKDVRDDFVGEFVERTSRREWVGMGGGGERVRR